MYHGVVKSALVEEGWTITHDPLVVPFGIHNLYVDLGAERLIAAERPGERIAVEIKSFAGASEVADMQQALGQYLMYRSLLRRTEPDRSLVLAVPADAFDTIFGTDLGRAILDDYAPIVLVFDPQREVIRQWVKK
ncbi:element excision factor XisH family protein [Sorangium sp. So ce131]|uniref:element excision factor XisH family protein n=1 Tax=Sorangium sp. So ce131 TaxID=3133282 RepID=UPI003F608326